MDGEWVSCRRGANVNRLIRRVDGECWIQKGSFGVLDLCFGCVWEEEGRTKFQATVTGDKFAIVSKKGEQNSKQVLRWSRFRCFFERC